MKLRKGIVLFLLVLSLANAAFAAPVSEYRQAHPDIKNVIVMIPDGMSMGGLTLSRWYKAYDPVTGTVDTGVSLALDEMTSGSIRTYWQTPETIGAITDSAPAGTAMATGKKTNDKHIAVSGDAVQVPYATILEAAKTLDKATGLIATSNIQHATPAAFSSHYFDRSRYDILAEQQVHQGLDVVLGSGSDYLTAPYRTDGEDMVEILKAAGYQYITTKDEMDALQKGKVWGMFAGDAMSYDMDRELTAANEPSLSEMTAKALELLSQNDNGFFLMVEGSKVDWAAHANDPIGVISDVLAFDEAVAVALDYAKAHQDTLVIAMTDHGNGGITIGDSETTDTYSKDPVSRFVAPLKKATLTGEGIGRMLNDDRSNIEEIMAQYFGVEDLTAEEIAAIQEAELASMNYVVGPIISKRANIGWTTGGHTGEDVTLFTYLPGDERIWGVIENTDVANVAAAIWGVDLDALTAQLYVNANESFETKGATVTPSEAEAVNPTLTVVSGDVTLEMQESKNYVLLNGKNTEIDGIIVQTNGVFYVPQSAIDLI